MRCKSCNYALWRLKSRTCPECGAPFKPSEHLFEPNSVRFRCPHCTQEYYGTDPMGLLTPREFDCVRCNAHIHMDEMVLEPAAGLSDEIAQRGNPWLDPRKMGRFTRWMKTVGMTLGRPTDLAQGTPRGQSGRAWWFAIRSNLTYTILGAAPIVIFPLLMGAAMGGRAGGGAGVIGLIAGSAVSLIVGLLVMIASLGIVLGLWILATHALLRLTGPIAGSLGDTGDCLCYASGANIVAAIPCLGLYTSALSWIWPAISGALMVREKHKVSGLRAAFATVTPPLAIAAAVVGLSVWAFTGLMSNAMNARATIAPSMSAISITAARSQASFMGLDPSMHAAHLVADDHLTVDDLLPYSSDELYASIVVDGCSLADLEPDPTIPSDEDKARRAGVVAAFKQAVPDNAPAYRLGDVVFIRNTSDASLSSPRWSAVIIPEGGVGRIGDSIIVLDQFGGTNAYPQPVFLQQLGIENAARVAAGLAPIPDPASIPHDQRGWTPPPPSIDTGAAPAPESDSGP